MQYSMVPGISRQTQSQKTGADGFRLSRVGACMLSAIPPPYFPPVLHIQSLQPACRQHQQGRKPGRYIVAYVIHFCRYQADIFIRCLHIAQHGIHGVHCLIKKAQRGAAQYQKKHGGHASVRGVFRYGLHRRPRHRLIIQSCRVSSDDHGYRPAVLFRIPGL